MSRSVDSSDFSGTADKWRTLLALSSKASVLLAGAAYESLADEFRQVFENVVIAPPEGADRARGSFDLVLVDVRGRLGARDRPDRLRALLTESGVLAQLRSRSLWERLGGRAPKALPGITSLSTTDQQQVPVEYWNPASPHPERPRKGYGCLLELSCASGDALAGLRLPREVVQAIAARIGDSVRVENIRFRRRGSVLISLRGTRASLILRISAAGQNRARLLRNREALQLLHEGMGLPPFVAARIPESVASLEIGDFAYDLETELAGLPLWRLPPGSRVRLHAAASATRFAQELEACLAVEGVLDAGSYDSVIGASIERVRVDLKDFPVAQSSLSALDNHLRSRVLRKPEPLAVGHGDYTPGNVLVDPGTGELLALVDWDTYHPRELVGADRWHFVLQEALATNEGDVSKARSALAQLKNLDVGIAMFAAVRMHERALEFGSEGVGARASHAAIIEAIGTLLPPAGALGASTL